MSKYDSYKDKPIDESGVDLIINEEKKEPTKPSRILKKTVANCKQVYIRSEADKDSKPLTILDVGTRLKVDASFEHEVFAKVELSDKTQGYIMKSFLR